jgi:hypothetical protein
MNGSRVWAVALAGLLVVPPVATAKTAGGGGRRAVPMHATAIDRSQYVDVNRVNMLVSNIGSFAFDGTNAALEFPKGSGKTAVFAGGLWLGGKINGVTKVAVTAYSNEWFPGPILPGGTPANPTDPIHRVYKLERVYANPATRDAALAAYNAGALPYGADTVTVQPDGTLNVLGDQMTWCVYNEADSVLKATSEEDAGHTGPMGVECQQTIFAFNRTGALGQTIFLRFRLINKGGNQIDSMFVSVWSDPDLGEFTDDLVGCDVPRSIGFVYNSTNDDAIYGSAPPCVGYDFFKGPKGYTGAELGLSSFNKYSNEAGGDPDLYPQVYNFMRGLNRDGTTVINPVNNQPTTFVVSGDPVAASGWLDSSPADRRLMLSSGPFQMAAGDTQEVVVGLVIGDADSRLASISLMRFYDSFAQSAFDQNFVLAPPPNPPRVTAAPAANSAILTWDTTSENYSTPAYEWEGYVVYQGASRSGPFQRLATFDRQNGITTVLDPDFDPESGQILPTVKALGTDRGVAYRYVATTDAIRGGPLRVGTPYYFAVSAYSVGIGQTPQVLESALVFDPNPAVTTVFTVIPQTPAAGVDLGSAVVSAGPTYGQVDSNLPAAKDSVTVTVVSPDQVITADYRIGYKPDATGVPTWYLVRTVGAAVDTVVNNWPNFGGDENFPVVDGIQVKVFGLLARKLLTADSTNVGPNPFALGGVDFGIGFFGHGADFAINLFGSSLDPTSPSAFGVFTDVEIRFTGGTPGQKAYRYMRSAGTPRTYLFQDFVDVPWTVWDIEGNRQLNAGFLENEVTADGTWNPGTGPDGNRELIWPMSSNYSATPDPIYTTTYPDGLNDSANIDFMYVLAPYTLTFEGTDPGTPVPLDAGDIFYFDQDIDVARAPTTETENDYFTFSTRTPNRMNVSLAQSELRQIKAVPNPYFAHSTYELNQFNRVVKFTHLPARCTVRIFTLAGELIRTLEKNDPTTSQLSWDIETASALPVASGIYIFHVEAPGIGTHVGKLAIFMEKERLNTF